MAIRKLDEEEIHERLRGLPGWSHTEHWIEKEYEFKNFLRAMSFVNAVAYVATSLNHHPDILIRYNQVTLRNWTHLTGGLTQYDFTLAEAIEKLVADG
jgi:4a-hydroxytetrahydrobiopterin dehydratase